MILFIKEKINIMMSSQNKKSKFDSELARAIATALARFGKIVQADEENYRIYGERYLNKSIDELIGDLLYSCGGDPVKLLRRINTMSIQFDGYCRALIKKKGDGYEQLIVKRPWEKASQSGSERNNK